MSLLRRPLKTGLFQPFPSLKRSPRSSLSILSQVKIPEFSQGSPHNTESFASFYKNESERKKVKKNPSIRAQICNKSTQHDHIQGTISSISILLNMVLVWNWMAWTYCNECMNVCSSSCIE
jgi:NAD-dependent dihydropyrimidine dehydrogenase PreA subunit